MLTEYQVQKIRRDMEPELRAGSGSIVACVAGLVTIVVLAGAAPQVGPDASRSAPAAAHETLQPAALNEAVPENAAGATMEMQAQVAYGAVKAAGAGDTSR